MTNRDCLRVVIGVVCLLICPALSIAGITASGDLFLGTDDPATWGSSMPWFGNTGLGAIDVDDGTQAYVSSLTLGCQSTGIGLATIEGAGTELTAGGVEAGWSGSAAINIRGGAVLRSNSVLQGALYAGSKLAISVNGPGSELWIAGGGMFVAPSGNGVVQVSNGGTLRSGSLELGASSTGTAYVTVSGAGSSLTTGDTYVGYDGTAMLDVQAGATATLGDVYISNGSMLSVEIGDSSLSTRFVENHGVVRLFAGSSVASGDYASFLTYGVSGDGVLEAFGGKWNPATSQFTVSDAVETSDGSQVVIDLDQAQRLNVDADLSMAFDSVQGGQLTVTATTSSQAVLAELEAELFSGADVLGSFDFMVSGLLEDSRTMLSYQIGMGQETDDLAIWHYDGEWTEYTPTTFKYEDGWLAFEVDGFSSYAVTGVVPEPATLSMLAIGGLAMLRRRK